MKDLKVSFKSGNQEIKVSLNSPLKIQTTTLAGIDEGGIIEITCDVNDLKNAIAFLEINSDKPKESDKK